MDDAIRSTTKGTADWAVSPTNDPVDMPARPSTTPQAVTRTVLADIRNASDRDKECWLYFLNEDWSHYTNKDLIDRFPPASDGGWRLVAHNNDWQAIKTPFDIDTSTTGNVYAGQGVFICIHLSDKDAYFEPARLKAVSSSKGPTEEDLYGLTHHYEAAGTICRHASFKVQSISAEDRRYAPFNIGMILVQSNGLILPTIYDPDVKNDG